MKPCPRCGWLYGFHDPTCGTKYVAPTLYLGSKILGPDGKPYDTSAYFDPEAHAYTVGMDFGHPTEPIAPYLPWGLPMMPWDRLPMMPWDRWGDADTLIALGREFDRAMTRTA